MEVNCSPVLEVADLLPMTHSRVVTLPDIVDIRIGDIALAFYFYPVCRWHWHWNIEKEPISMNSFTSWTTKHCFDITLPTMRIEYAVL